MKVGRGFRNRPERPAVPGWWRVLAEEYASLTEGHHLTATTQRFYSDR